MTTVEKEDTSTEAPVLFETSGRIATITLNRPSRLNALDSDAWAGLQSAIGSVRADSGIRVLVLRGSGGNFCAGADVRAPRVPTHPLRRMSSITDVVRDLFELEIPTIAGVEGVAVGAGWNLALACDLVLAARNARFSQIFAKRGLSVDCGGSWLLPRIVGVQRAKQLLYLAEMIPAEEAARLGLVLEIHEADELGRAVAALADRLAEAPPVALAQNKALLNTTWNASFAEQLRRENTAQTINFATDGPVARVAIANGDQPIFEGKWQL